MFPRLCTLMTKEKACCKTEQLYGNKSQTVKHINSAIDWETEEFLLSQPELWQNLNVTISKPCIVPSMRRIDWQVFLKSRERLPYRCTRSMFPFFSTSQSESLICFFYFVYIILVMLFLLCMSVFFHVWSLALDYMFFYYR